MEAMGHGADAPSMYGALQLLDEQGIQRHTYTIRKSTITLGRALSNDVRLLLEDVSREHCRIEFNDECKVRTQRLTKAVLHILGANGIVHNGSLVKPNASCDRVELADGDKLKISKHTLSFSYTSLRPDSLNEVATPSPQRSTPRRGRQSKADSPVTPRRQSARLKAKYSSPCLKASVMSPQAEPTPSIHSNSAEVDSSVNASLMQPADELATESSATARDTDFSNPATDDIPAIRDPGEAIEAKHVSDTLEEPSSMPIQVQENAPTSTETGTVEFPQIPEPSVLQDEEQKSDSTPCVEEPTSPVSSGEPEHPVEQVATAPTKPLDLVPSQQEDSELSLAVETATPSDKDDSVQTLHLDDMEAAAVADNLLNESPSADSPVSPQPSNARMPSTLPFSIPRTPPLQWTPSKSRKVSLRTATLLKRSAQYPLVPLSEMRTANQSTVPANRSPTVPRTSTGSRDMDMTRDFGDDASSDSDSSSEDEDEIDRSLGSSGSGPEFERPKTPEPNQRAPVLTNFLTPQQPKQRTLRRMSNPDMSASTPKLKSRSSWQWLRDLFKSPTTRDEKQTDAQPSNDNKESSTALESEPLVSEAATSTANDPAPPAHDEFFDVENEVDSAEAFEPMDIEASSTTPDVTLTNTSWMYQLPSSPAPSRALDGNQTPDMQGLKHMFAEPPRLASESVLSDFRHVMRPDTTPENDFSLASAWNTITAEPEEHDGPWHDVSEEPVSLHPPQAEHESHEVEVPSSFLESEEKEHKDETEKSGAGAKEGPSGLPSDAPQETTVTPDDLVTTPEIKSRSKQSAPIVPVLDATTPTLLPTTRHETTIEASLSKSNYLKERTTNEIMANLAENKTDDQRATSTTIPSKDAEKTRAKVRVEATAPVRMSPRRAAAQAQRVQTQTTQATSSSGMAAPRAVPQKEPYVPVRRRLPARTAVSNLGSMTTTATRASRTRVADSEEQVHGPNASASDTIGRRVTGHTSIPLAANGRRSASTLQRNDTVSSKPGSTRGAGARTARTARSSRQI